MRTRAYRFCYGGSGGNTSGGASGKRGGQMVGGARGLEQEDDG